MDGSARHDGRAPEAAVSLDVHGTLQAAWKQRDTLFRPRFGSLGLVALPNLLLFQVVFPLVSPVMDLELFVSGAAALVQSMQHPQEFSADTFSRTLFYYAVFIAVDGLAAVFGFLLERDEDWTLLIWLPLQRFWYRQLMYCVAVKSTLMAIRGIRGRVGQAGTEGDSRRQSRELTAFSSSCSCGVPPLPARPTTRSARSRAGRGIS